MRGCKELPKTSSPSLERFMEVYGNEEYEEIIVFTLTSKLSGTYSNAVISKNMYLEDHDYKRIEVIDSENGSIAVALMILKTHQLIEAGKNMVRNFRGYRTDEERYGILWYSRYFRKCYKRW